MAVPPARPRHFADRPRVQPARRRTPRRLRSALLALITVVVGACGDAPRETPSQPDAPQAKEPTQPKEDCLRRFVQKDWGGAGAEAITTKDLVAGLKRYIKDDTQPIFPVGPGERSPHVRALARFLFRRKPDPAQLAALFQHGEDPPEVSDELLRRDVVGTAVAHTLTRRAYQNPDASVRTACYDAIGLLSTAFAFDRAYGNAHTNTSVIVTDFLSKPEFQPCAESGAALKKHYGAIIKEWRRRVTDKGSSTFFGIVMRHLGSGGTAMLFEEWRGMRPAEREDLLLRVAYQDETTPVVRKGLVGALLDNSFDVRAAAHKALTAHEAPLDELDDSAADDAIEKALPRLHKWAQET